MSLHSVCPLCGSKKYVSFWAMPGYELFRCSKCSLVWDPFPPENVTAQYQENYFINNNPKGGYANYFEGMKINSITFKDRLQRIKNKTKINSALLDIGSALGDCLLQAKKLGWKNILGLDTSVFACQSAQKRGANVKCGTLDTVKLPSNNFSLVLAQDVIEHIPDPLTFLKKIHSLLKPGGYLFIVTPEMDGFWLKLLRRFWYHYKPQEHLVYFSQSTMKQALKEAGFNNIETRPTYHIMSVEYIFRRLIYYSPGLFSLLLKLSQILGISQTPLRVYAGELEAWAQKP